MLITGRSSVSCFAANLYPRARPRALRREAESQGRVTEAPAANRNLGMACLYQDALGDAQTYLAEARRIYDPERDRDARFRFGVDTGIAASSLAQTKWYLGEIDRALELIEDSGRRAVESGHAPTLALVHHLKGMFDMQRIDAAAALSASETLVQLTREHPMALYHADASVHVSLTRYAAKRKSTGFVKTRKVVGRFQYLRRTGPKVRPAL
jgi:hypothetical protein